MVVTEHYFDNHWERESVILEINRFYTPHTFEAAEAFLKDVIETWNLIKRIQCVTTDNASDMIRGTLFLYLLLF